MDPAKSLARSRPSRRTRWLVMLVCALLLGAIAAGEWIGWSFLRQPIASLLSARMGRTVSLTPPFALHLRRTIELSAAEVKVSAPEWSNAPHFVQAAQVVANVNYGVLFGRAPIVSHVGAAELDVNAERLADGQASWRFGSGGATRPRIEILRVRKAHVSVKDALHDLGLTMDGSTDESAAGNGSAGLRMKGAGHWHTAQIEFELASAGALPLASGDESVSLRASGQVGQTRIDYQGEVQALLIQPRGSGQFKLSGPSLSELGQIPGVTLPRTPPYRMTGRLDHSATISTIEVADARIGRSELAGRFQWDRSKPVRHLSGELTGKVLVLTDLAPAVGVEPGALRATTATETRARADGKRPAAPAAQPRPEAGKSATTQVRRVLPRREFSLPALQRMTADVAVNVDRFDAGTSTIGPLDDFRTRIRLSGGLLEISDLTAKAAGGDVSGQIRFDAVDPAQVPRWAGKLRWVNIELARWVKQGAGKLFVDGRFSGDATFTSVGRSTGAALGQANGQLRMRVDGGKLSHQLVELAGLDVAQAVGVTIRGDELLAVPCAVGDFTAKEGVLQAQVGLIDTPDTTFWVTGTVNLHDESMALRVVQMPKDWSPLSLRTPITVNGSLSQPRVGIEPRPLALKLVASLALGAINPLAALLPLMDFAPADKAGSCAAALERVRKHPAFAKNGAAP